MTTTYSPGSIIRNRNRLWRVDGQDGDVLIASSIDASQPEQFKFYLPFENVVSASLPLPDPARMGSVQDHDLLVRAFRLSMLHGSAPLLSLQRSRVIPKDYQLVPVVMALEMPRVRMLLADDVGLGKTIEAGLITTELMARGQASRLLVVVPASLREQWREALEYFFHIDARIISTRHRRDMEKELPAGADPWEYFPALITSVDYAKRSAHKHAILDQRWDMVIVDEAHLAAKPHQSGPDQSVSMDRYDFVNGLSQSERVKHMLLLTATPHNGYTDSFASLVRMLDVGAVKGPPHNPTILREVAQRHVCQRRRQDVEAWFAEDPERSPFPQRDQEEVIVPPTSYEKEAIDALHDYGDKVLASASGQSHASVLAHWTVLHLHKRALSSPEALRQSLKNRRASLGQRLKDLEASGDAAVTKDEARANVLDEDTGERLDDEEAGERLERVSYGSAAQIKAELELLEGVEDKAKRITKSRDSKLNKLLDVVLRNMLARDPHVIVFTRFVDTLEYLEEQIEQDKRYADATVITIHGSHNEQKRAELFQQFERAEQGILIATDAISEGINLQHAAGKVIHYELPWNPNRLEQRNGRVDRFGQQRDIVTIRTMVMDETLDASILSALIEKARKIRQDFGFSPPYFGDERSIIDLIRQHDVELSPRQISFFEAWGEGGVMSQGRAVEDPFDDDVVKKIEQDSFYGQTDVQLPQVEERLEQTRQAIGSPEEIRRFVVSGLRSFGCTVNQRSDGYHEIHISDPDLQVASVGETIPKATFDAERALDKPDVQAIDLGHPVVRRLIEEVKQQGFQHEDHYGRSCHMVAKQAEHVIALAHILARYRVGTQPISIMEELIPVGIPLEGGSLLKGDDVLRLIRATPVGETVPWAQEDLAELLGMETLNQLLEQTAEDHRAGLVEERRAMMRSMQQQVEGGEAIQWLEGMDDITLTSHDLLTIQLQYPPTEAN